MTCSLANMVTTAILQVCRPTIVELPDSFIRHFGNYVAMPRKIRELIRDLERAGFVNRGGRGDHRNFVHPKVVKPVTVSGNAGGDAKQYQERAVKRAIEESRS